MPFGSLLGGLGFGVGAGAGGVVGGRLMDRVMPCPSRSRVQCSCGMMNPKGTRFCNNCGEDCSDKQCPCGRVNPAAARFCGGCRADMSKMQVVEQGVICECGFAVTEGAKFCQGCARPLQSDDPNACKTCQAINKPSDKFCRECGGKKE